MNADTLEKYIGKFTEAKDLVIELKETVFELKQALDEEKDSSTKFRRRVREICDRAEQALNGASGIDSLLGELKILKLEIENGK